MVCLAKSMGLELPAHAYSDPKEKRIRLYCKLDLLFNTLCQYMGAVGGCLSKSYFSEEKKTEGVAFRRFIKELKRDYIKPEFRNIKPYILLDNHPVGAL